jgi:cytochrome c oxidase subunit I
MSAGSRHFPAARPALPDVGWFGYAPLTSTAYYSSPDSSTDLWVLGLQILGVSSVVGSLNFIVTIINMRAPGLTMMRLPVFTWMTLVTSFLIILSFPAITIALVEAHDGPLLRHRASSRRQAAASPSSGSTFSGSSATPRSTSSSCPPMGIVSEILPTFSRKPLFGYPIVVFSGAVIGFLGFGVWSHHMFTTGMGTVATAAFSLATMAIAVPTGVKIFNWIGTLWGGHIMTRTPMMFALGFIWMFMMGGFSGVMHSAAPADAQQQDSYFVVAHFHYVLIGGSHLRPPRRHPLLVPEVFGRMVLRVLGQALVLGHLRRLQRHLLPDALPRPERHAPPHRLRRQHGLERPPTSSPPSAPSSSAIGIGIYFAVMVYTYFKGKKATGDVWDARTLEWAVPTTPPPEHNFHVTPTVHARDAFWYEKTHAKEIAAEKEKTAAETESHGGIHMPSQSWFPLITALGLLIGGLFFAHHNFMGAIAGGCILFLGVIGWAFEGPGGYHLHIAKDGTVTGGEGQDEAKH